jgi:hypothetical protein
MNFQQVGIGVLVVALTILSGFADSRGFVYASSVWENGQLVWDALIKSALGFSVGILMYWIALRYLPRLEVAASTEMQTLGWFCVTIVGVALSSGQFVNWAPLDKLVGIGIIAGLGWLLFRGV